MRCVQYPGYSHDIGMHAGQVVVVISWLHGSRSRSRSGSGTRRFVRDLAEELTPLVLDGGVLIQVERQRLGLGYFGLPIAGSSRVCALGASFHCGKIECSFVFDWMKVLFYFCNQQILTIAHQHRTILRSTSIIIVIVVVDVVLGIGHRFRFGIFTGRSEACRRGAWHRPTITETSAGRTCRQSPSLLNSGGAYFLEVNGNSWCGEEEKKGGDSDELLACQLIVKLAKLSPN